MWNFISNLFKNAKFAIPSFTVDDEGFREINLNGSRKTILWSELEHVGILTTADGPFMEDLFYIIKSKTDFMCISQLGAARVDLLSKFDRLAGFKWEVALQAMTCVDPMSFACWDKNWEKNEPLPSS